MRTMHEAPQEQPQPIPAAVSSPRAAAIYPASASLWRPLTCGFALVAGLAAYAWGQEGGPAAARGPASFWEIFLAGGTVGWCIVLLSVAAVALTIEQLFTLRARALMPAGLAESVRQLLPPGRVAEAEALCRQQPCLLSYVLHAGLREVDSGWSEVQQAVEESLSEQAARLLRKIEYLALIGNLAPMLGLLGTVVGMVMAFREVAETQGTANAADLAQGIYLALVTTVEGLVVAIPAVGAFTFLRNRVDELLAEATYQAQHTLAPLKRRLLAGPPAPPAVGPAREPPRPGGRG